MHFSSYLVTLKVVSLTRDGRQLLLKTQFQASGDGDAIIQTNVAKHEIQCGDDDADGGTRLRLCSGL